MVAHPVPIWGKGSHETKSKAFRLEKIKKSPLPFSELSGLDSSIFFDSRVLILDKRPLFGWGDMGINSANKNGNWRNGTKSGDMRHKNCK